MTHKLLVTEPIAKGTVVDGFSRLPISDVFSCDLCGGGIPKEEVVFVNGNIMMGNFPPYPVNSYAHYDCLPEWLQLLVQKSRER